MSLAHPTHNDVDACLANIEFRTKIEEAILKSEEARKLYRRTHLIAAVKGFLGGAAVLLAIFVFIILWRIFNP